MLVSSVGSAVDFTRLVIQYKLSELCFLSDRRVSFWLLNFKGARNIQRNLISFIGIDTGRAGTLNLDLTSYGICAKPLSIVIVWGGVLLVFWGLGLVV